MCFLVLFGILICESIYVIYIAHIPALVLKLLLSLVLCL